MADQTNNREEGKQEQILNNLNNEPQNQQILDEEPLCIFQVQFDQQEEKLFYQETLEKQQITKLQAEVAQLQMENNKLNALNLKLYQKLANIDEELITKKSKLDEFEQKINADAQLVTDLQKLVSQQREFIEQVNNDQAYNDLTEQLEISLQQIATLEQENNKLLEKNLYFKTKYEESLIYIKNSKEEMLNKQERQIDEQQLQETKQTQSEIKDKNEENRLLDN